MEGAYSKGLSSPALGGIPVVAILPSGGWPGKGGGVVETSAGGLRGVTSIDQPQTIREAIWDDIEM